MTRRAWCLVAAIAACRPAGGETQDDERFGLGRPATEAEVAALDIDVGPDGAGLPEGGATATDGASIYADNCAVCHGTEGEGASALALAGDGRRAIGNYWPYATTLYDYINRSMPFDRPGSLTPTEVYGVVAWILARNDIIGADAEMNATSLPAVQMPARDLFYPDDRR